MPPTSSLLDLDSSESESPRFLHVISENASQEVKFLQFFCCCTQPTQAEASHGASIFYLPLYRVPTTEPVTMTGWKSREGCSTFMGEWACEEAWISPAFIQKVFVLKEPRSLNVKFAIPGFPLRKTTPGCQVWSAQRPASAALNTLWASYVVCLKSSSRIWKNLSPRALAKESPVGFRRERISPWPFRKLYI